MFMFNELNIRPSRVSFLFSFKFSSSQAVFRPAIVALSLPLYVTDSVDLSLKASNQLFKRAFD